VTTACCPSAVCRNRGTSAAEEGDVVEGSFRIYFDHLRSRTYASCRPPVEATWLYIIGQELEAAEVTHKDAQ
jgi:hypothetical protein